MGSQLAQATGQALSHELSEAVGRIGHCVGQLTYAQVWHRPEGGLNSIGNLLLHLAGNVRQWVISGVGGATDNRDRPGEFAERQQTPWADLWAKLQAAVEEAQAVLGAQKAEDWLRVRRIQGFEVNGLQAAVNSVAHFRGHTQEIIHMTRALLGEKYRFAWVPALKEQGAPSA
jgi:hypothetical protein